MILCKKYYIFKANFINNGALFYYLFHSNDGLYFLFFGLIFKIS